MKPSERLRLNSESNLVFPNLQVFRTCVRACVHACVCVCWVCPTVSMQTQPCVCVCRGRNERKRDQLCVCVINKTRCPVTTISQRHVLTIDLSMTDYRTGHL